MKKILLTLGTISTIPLIGLAISCGSSSKDLVVTRLGITYKVHDGKLSITYPYTDEQTVWEVMDRIKIITLTNDETDKQIASYFPLVPNANPDADIYTNLDTNALFKLITIENAPESFMTTFNRYQSGELVAPVAEAPQVDEHGNVIRDEESLTIDLDTMTVQEAQDWMNAYNAYKTRFNINIHMLITRGSDTLYDVVWEKGADRAHSDYGRGMNIDLYGPGDDFYDCYNEILAKSQEQP